MVLHRRQVQQLLENTEENFNINRRHNDLCMQPASEHAEQGRSVPRHVIILKEHDSNLTGMQHRNGRDPQELLSDNGCIRASVFSKRGAMALAFNMNSCCLNG